MSEADIQKSEASGEEAAPSQISGGQESKKEEDYEIDGKHEYLMNRDGSESILRGHRAN